MTRAVLLYDEMYFSAESRNLLKKHFALHSLPNPGWDSRMGVDILRSIEAIFAPPSWTFSKQLKLTFPNLKYIVCNMTAPSHVEEIEGVELITLEKRPILQGITSTAEHTLGLIMALHRRIPAAFHEVTTQTWNRYKWGAPRMLSSMYLGIVGRGRVGRHLEKISIPIFKDVFGWRSAVELEHSHARYDIGMCDVVAICASVEKGSEQPIFGRHEIYSMKKGALLVNTARAEVLSYPSLLKALEEGRLRGAALDCLPREYSKGMWEKSYVNHRLVDYARTHDNLIITPHIAGSTEDAWQMTQTAVIEELIEKLT